MTATRQNLLNMLCDLSALSRLAINSQNVEDFLQGVVSLTSRHLGTPVCSIYLYDERTDDLVLRATVGLNPDAVNHVRMPTGAGLVGTVMAASRYTCEGRASLNPNFLYFPETNELPYESFLAVPIHNGMIKIGVLVVQHSVPDFFDQTDIMVLKATADQLVAVLENARLVMNSQPLPPAPKKPTLKGETIQGEPASGGWAMGPCAVWGKSHVRFVADPHIPEQGGLTEFCQALQKTTDQLDGLQKRFVERLPESTALIFAAHLMILKDPEFVDRITHAIQAGTPATRAVQTVAHQYIRRFSDSPHPYIREKVSDIEDLAGRLLGNLISVKNIDDMDSGGKVVVAVALYPSELLKLAAESAAGIVLVNGGVASHVAIISRSLKIPMVVIQHPDFMNLDEGTPLFVDGDSGAVHVEPQAAVVSRFESFVRTRQQLLEHTPSHPDSAAITCDGAGVDLFANINLLTELPLAGKVGAVGIGLYRTEFPFLVRPSFPSETEQYLVYRQLAEAMGEKPVVFRTLDIGGEKTVAYAQTEMEANPELGLRSIRFTLKYKDIFEQQIRAILRAGADRQELAIMFPLISSVDDFCRARQVVYSCIDQLRAEGLPHHAHPLVGMMIELPAVAETMSEYAVESDFFSIGTNDFVQYMLAVDRSNKQVANYYRHDHPAVLRALARIVKTATDHDKPISICGEMAHDKTMIPFLLGIGLRRLSVDPQFIPMVRKIVGSLSIAKCRSYATTLLSSGSIEAVQAISRYQAAGFAG